MAPIDTKNSPGYTEQWLENVIRSAVISALNDTSLQSAHFDNRTCDISERMLNAEDVADMLRVSTPTAYELLNHPDAPTIRVGRRLVVDRRDLLDWLKTGGHQREAC